MRRATWAALTLALSAHIFQAKAQGIKTYLESSGTQQKARSNAGLSVQSDRLRIRADVALQATQVEELLHGLDTRLTSDTKVVPNLRSGFMIAENLDLETGVSFAEWNAPSDTTFNTRLRYKKSLDFFFDELDGSVWRSADGLMNQSMRLGFHEIVGGDLSPLTISGAAVFEAMHNETAALPGIDRHKVRIETKVAGLMPAFLGADHTVGLKVERTAGSQPESARLLTYDQTWAPSPSTKLGLNWQFLRRDDIDRALAPSLDFTWRSKF